MADDHNPTLDLSKAARQVCRIEVIWDPNTGKVHIATDGGNFMEYKGMLHTALEQIHAIMMGQQQTDNRITPASGLPWHRVGG